MSRVCLLAARDPDACVNCPRVECIYDEEQRVCDYVTKALGTPEHVRGTTQTLFTYGDREESIRALAREAGIDYNTLYMRIYRGDTVEEALARPYKAKRRDRKERMDLMSLADEIHAAAVGNGFWEAFDAEERNIVCMHAEIAEAIQADRLGMPIMEIERDGAKPEGVGVELADFCMRLLDYAAHRRAVLRPLDFSHQRHCSLPHLALRLHKLVTIMCDKVADKQVRLTRVSDCIEDAITACGEWLAAQGYSLIDLIAAKMEYNKTRPVLHGKKY